MPHTCLKEFIGKWHTPPQVRSFAPGSSYWGTRPAEERRGAGGRAASGWPARLSAWPCRAAVARATGGRPAEPCPRWSDRAQACGGAAPSARGGSAGAGLRERGHAGAGLREQGLRRAAAAAELRPAGAACVLVFGAAERWSWACSSLGRHSTRAKPRHVPGLV